MNLLEQLKAANPNLPLFDVFDPAFSEYGRVLDLPGIPELAEALGETRIPDQGNRYVASLPELEALSIVSVLERAVFGGMAVQAGFCNGRGHRLNAEEYHKCSEVNFSTTGLVLLLAKQEAIRERSLDSGSVIGFYLPPMTPVEILPMVLHFAPCRVSEDGFNCLVVLTRGTNESLDRVDPGAPGEEGLLWMRNKWLLSHPDSPQAANGAFVGIRGENISLALPRTVKE